MNKVEFITKLEEVKKRLPVGVVPLYLKAFPNVSESRLKNTVSGRIQDEEILANLERLAEQIENIH